MFFASMIHMIFDDEDDRHGSSEMTSHEHEHESSGMTMTSREHGHESSEMAMMSRESGSGDDIEIMDIVVRAMEGDEMATAMLMYYKEMIMEKIAWVFSCFEDSTEREWTDLDDYEPRSYYE